jgi:hypothetical protein
MLDKSTLSPNDECHFPPKQLFVLFASTKHRPICRQLMAIPVVHIRSSLRVLHALAAAALVIGLIVAHSVTTELLQIVIPLRTCDPVDLTANWLGIALGVRLTAHVPQAMAMLQQQQFFIAGVRTPNSLPSNSESGRFSQSNHERQRTS